MVSTVGVDRLSESAGLGGSISNFVHKFIGNLDLVGGVSAVQYGARRGRVDTNRSRPR